MIDTAAIVFIESLPGESNATGETGLEGFLGPVARDLLADLHSWQRRFVAIEALIAMLSLRYEALAPRYGVGGNRLRVVVEPTVWATLSAEIQDSIFLEIRDRWFAIAGEDAHLEITGTREANFVVLRD